MVDVREVAVRLREMGHDVRMVTPHFETYFPRGRISLDPGFPVDLIPFNRFSFNSENVRKQFRRKVDAFRPDIVFLTDGYSLKPHLSEALKEYPQVWRAYSYEVFCPLNNLVDKRLDYVCNKSIFKDQKWCESCCRHHFKYRRSWIKLISPIKFRIGYLFLFQEYWFSRANRPEFLETFERAIRRAKAILVYNDRQRAFFSQFQSNVIFAPTGVSPLFHPRENNAATRSRPVILVSGRIEDPVKGFMKVFFACKELYRKGIDFELWITAKPNAYIPSAPFIRNIGWLDADRLAEATARADIICIPSYWEEAFGIVAVEAMASAKPVVACRVGGLQKIVQHGKTGLLVEPNSSADLAEKLKFLIQNQEIATQMGHRGRERFLESYRWEVIMQTVYEPLFRTPSETQFS